MNYRIYLGHNIPHVPRVLEYTAEKEISPAEIIDLVKKELTFKVDRILILMPHKERFTINEGDKEYA